MNPRHIDVRSNLTDLAEPAGFSIRRVRYRPDEAQARHSHEQTTATLICSGSLAEVVGSVSEEAVPLSAVFKPAGTEHANQIGPCGACTVQISFAPNFLRNDSSPLSSEWAWSHGGVAAKCFVDLATCWRLRHDDERQLEGRVWDVVSSLQLGAAVMWDPAPNWLLRIVEEVEDTFNSPRRVRDMAADAGIHPVALARAHRRHYGVSISDRIRARRIRVAADLLGCPELTLVGIALRAGFSDQSHFTRVFKAEVGITPGRFRTLHLA